MDEEEADYVAHSKSYLHSISSILYKFCFVPILDDRSSGETSLFSKVKDVLSLNYFDTIYTFETIS